jgi:restriction endonuclease Mrr
MTEIKNSKQSVFAKTLPRQAPGSSLRYEKLFVEIRLRQGFGGQELGDFGGM